MDTPPSTRMPRVTVLNETYPNDIQAKLRADAGVGERDELRRGRDCGARGSGSLDRRHEG